MIGDSESDIIPAKKLGMFTLFRSEKQSLYADLNFRNFGDLPFWQKTYNASQEIKFRPTLYVNLGLFWDYETGCGF
jgi:hypothetical protein